MCLRLFLFYFTCIAAPLPQWLKIQLLVKMYIALISLFYKYFIFKNQDHSPKKMDVFFTYLWHHF